MNAEGGLILILGLMFGVPLLLGLLHLLNRLAGRTLIPLWLSIALLIVRRRRKKAVNNPVATG